MNITEADYTFIKLLAKVFSPAYDLEKSWLITGLWREAQEKVILLLKNSGLLSPYYLREIGIHGIEFPFRTAFVSYQENIFDRHATYYQQRFHATETDEIKTLKKFLFEENVNFKIVHRHYELLKLFNLKHLLEEEVIKLSTGETRKATILKALLTNPQVLILDNPFAGIDQNTVPELDKVFSRLAANGLNLIIVSNTEMPGWVSNVLWVNSPEDVEVFSPEDFSKKGKQVAVNNEEIHCLKVPPVAKINGERVVKLNDVSVTYGDKRVLHHINWQIKQGEKWILKGANGAGKSTLLSLIYADHPQAYANDIELFGIKRGSGESIWDIKEKMSFYSPEFCHYFDKKLTCRETLLSGIYFHPFKRGVKNAELENFALSLFLQFFSVDKLDIPLNRLSSVNQRLVLLLRTLAQNAPLVLLDEPFQGFDQELTIKCKRLTELCCLDKSLIFISHNPEDVPAFIKNVFQISNGEASVLGNIP